MKVRTRKEKLNKGWTVMRGDGTRKAETEYMWRLEVGNSDCRLCKVEKIIMGTRAGVMEVMDRVMDSDGQ